MNVAFLFNANHRRLGGMYGWKVQRLIASTGVLQSSKRTMRVSIGDIRTWGRVQEADRAALCEQVYRANKFRRIKRTSTSARSTVYCWLFQNMTMTLAHQLDAALLLKPGYLGAMDVDFGDLVQLTFFRNWLSERYRIEGRRCSIFFHMGDNESPDIAVAQVFQKAGFRVAYEDSGARRTVFDDYDTVEHWQRVGDFERVFAEIEGLDEDEASEITLTLEELHPKLFDAFSAAARVLKRADTSEELAQAALSGRRLLEQTADYLFPPRAAKSSGKALGRAQYKNRLWGYVETTLSGLGNGKVDERKLQKLGTEIDRLATLFNSGLHDKPDKKQVELAFRDLVIWLKKIIALNPAAARKPYLAYAETLSSVLKGS